jgi:hypothetical protein
MRLLLTEKRGGRVAERHVESASHKINGSKGFCKRYLWRGNKVLHSTLKSCNWPFCYSKPTRLIYFYFIRFYCRVCVSQVNLLFIFTFARNRLYGVLCCLSRSAFNAPPQAIT